MTPSPATREGQAIAERLDYWRNVMTAKSGWANNVSGPCCDKCRMSAPKDPLQALCGCKDPFQINCQCHIPHREAVRQIIIRELEAVEKHAGVSETAMPGPTHYYCMDCDEFVREPCKIEGCPIPKSATASARGTPVKGLPPYPLQPVAGCKWPECGCPGRWDCEAETRA